MHIAIIGISGVNARAWSAAARTAGHKVRHLARHVSAASLGRQPAVPFDLDDPASFAPSLEGVEVLALATPSEPAQVRRECALIDAAARAGIKRIVKLSVMGAELDPPASIFGQWHGEIEGVLRRADIPHVILRPNFFLQSLMPQAEAIRNGIYRQPLGDAPVSFVDVRDIADTAIVAFSGRLDGQIVTITGPRPLSGTEIAAEFARHFGRSVRYVSPPLDVFEADLRRRGVAEWRVDALVELYRVVQAGHPAGIDAVCRRHPEGLATPPRDIRDFLRDEFGS